MQLAATAFARIWLSQRSVPSRGPGGRKEPTGRSERRSPASSSRSCPDEPRSSARRPTCFALRRGKDADRRRPWHRRRSPAGVATCRRGKRTAALSPRRSAPCKRKRHPVEAGQRPHPPRAAFEKAARVSPAIPCDQAADAPEKFAESVLPTGSPSRSSVPSLCWNAISKCAAPRSGGCDRHARFRCVPLPREAVAQIVERLGQHELGRVARQSA